MTPICVLNTTKNELQIVILVVYASETNYKGFTGFSVICIGNSMICSDIWHKYHERYFEIVIRKIR